MGRLLVEEHNHGKLWMGFGISFFMFGIAIFMAFTVTLAEEIINQLFIVGVALMLIVASIIMLRGVKYKFGRKKNV